MRPLVAFGSPPAQDHVVSSIDQGRDFARRPLGHCGLVHSWGGVVGVGLDRPACPPPPGWLPRFQRRASQNNKCADFSLNPLQRLKQPTPTRRPDPAGPGAAGGSAHKREQVCPQAPTAGSGRDQQEARRRGPRLHHDDDDKATHRQQKQEQQEQQQEEDGPAVVVVVGGLGVTTKEAMSEPPRSTGGGCRGCLWGAGWVGHKG
jgi:hypothetical protein